MTVTELYDTFKEQLKGYATRLAHDADQADDLVQETLIKALAHLDLLNHLAPPQQQAWLFHVLKNRFLDQQRAHKRWLAMLDRLAHAALTDDRDFAHLAEPRLLDVVPDRYRELLEKRYVLGMTSEEIGHLFGVPPATVRSRLRLAINWLRMHQSEFI